MSAILNTVVQNIQPVETAQFGRGAFRSPIRIEEGITLIPGSRGTWMKDGSRLRSQGEYSWKDGILRDTRPKIILPGPTCNVEVLAKNIEQFNRRTWDATGIVTVQVSPNFTIRASRVEFAASDREIFFSKYAVIQHGNYTFGAISAELDFWREPVLSYENHKGVIRCRRISD